MTSQLRHFLIMFTATTAIVLTTFSAHAKPGFASGIRIGEVTPDSAIIWVRLTDGDGRNADGIVFEGRPARYLPETLTVQQLEGYTQGLIGKVRVQYWPKGNKNNSQITDWQITPHDTDYTTQFPLANLTPSTDYLLEVEAQGSRKTIKGKFSTAPISTDNARVLFTALTCQYYGERDHPDGHHIYPSMLKMNPDFMLSIGDNVYYDNEAPRVTNAALARYHWQRMYSLPLHVDFLRQVPTYFLKDDHDTMENDCWPGKKAKVVGPFTFEEGLPIFLEQVPMGDKTHRTMRWGNGLQIWMMEGRDFRSPNTMPDGPDKTIWGAEQIAWLKKSMKESDAQWKILVSPTPIVGPDRKNKKDSHANPNFTYAGNAIRTWLKEEMNNEVIVVVGDRHWQYHSIHPESGLHEFACGPASDEHASGTPGFMPDYHQFHRVKGGFLSGEVTWQDNTSSLTLSHHDVHGTQVYTHTYTK